jgi:hypothetical protein
MATRRSTDLLVHGHASTYLLRASSGRGQPWLDEHVFDDHQERAGAIVVEHRYVVDIVAGAREAGLEVR